jgi:hypothetical protein
MIRLLLCLLVLLIALAATGSDAASLCNDTRPDTDNPIREGDFDLYRAQRNLEYLASLGAPFDQAIAKAAAHQAADPGTLPSAKTFAISYPNALRQIQGALLKQRAEFADQGLQLAKAHRRAKDARAAQANLEAARKEFCDFLATSRYAD